MPVHRLLLALVAVVLALGSAPAFGQEAGSVLVYLRDRADQEVGGGCVELRGEQSRHAACDDDGTDADGRPGIVRLDNVPFGSYIVVVDPAPPGYERPRSRTVEVSASEPEVRVSIRLNPGTAAGSPVAGGCPALEPAWAPVLQWQPDVVAAQQQVLEELAVLVPEQVVLAIIRIESQGVMPEGAGSEDQVGLMGITAMTLGADGYDLERAAVDPAYSIYAGTYELALRYLDSGELPWRNVVVGFFAGHYYPDGSRDAYSSDLEYQARFDEYVAELEACGGEAQGTPVAGAEVSDNWLAGVGQPIDGLAALWGGAPLAGGGPELVQEFGPTAESAAHPEWYTYALDYGFPEPGHPGLDLGMPPGTPLYAPSDAVVVCAGTGNGNGEDGCVAFTAAAGGPTSGRLQLRLPSGDVLIYGHVADSVVAPGARVRAGELVGHSGGPPDGGDWIHLEYRVPDPDTASGWRVVDPRLTPLNVLEVKVSR